METREVVARFYENVMRPLARILMRFGTSAREAGDVTRWSFVKSFYETPEFWQHAAPTILQGAIKTGLPRQQVKALHDMQTPSAAVFTNRQNLADRVIEGWVNDPEFQLNGEPMPLPVKHRSGPTFNKLVMRYGVDTNTSAILGDLRLVGCVTVENDVVTLVNRTYGLNVFDEDKLELAGYMIKRLAETTDFNLVQPVVSERRLQRFWRQVLIPKEQATEARRRVRETAVEAGRRIDSQLASLSHEKPRKNQQYVEIGIVMYQYEDVTDSDGDFSKDDLKQRSKI